MGRFKKKQREKKRAKRKRRGFNKKKGRTSKSAMKSPIKASKKSNNLASIKDVDQLINFAEKYKGTPYVFGGKSSMGFDCSGFTQHVFENADINIPRTSGSQAKEGSSISLSQARKGDLIFFGKSRSKVTHVGIVVSDLGEDIKMIHASSSQGITITNVSESSYWKPKINRVRRYRMA